MNELLSPIDLSEICAKFPCAAETKSLLAANLSPSAFIEKLQAQNLSVDAVQCLARCMPKEKAVAWAVESARLAGEKIGLSPEAEKTLTATQSWIEEPGAFTLSQAEKAVAELEPDSPAYWAATAATHADPSEMPEELLLQIGAEDLTAKFAAGSVLLSAATLSPDGIPAELKEAIAIEPVQVDELIMDTVTQQIEMPQLPELPELPPVPQADAGPYLAPFIEKGLKIAQSVPGWS